MNHRFLWFAIILVAAACQNNTSEKSIGRIDNFSSPKSLFVDYVSSFTSGVVSTQAPIRLRLSKSLPDSLRTADLNEVFRFSPSIAGSATWEDNRTVIFQPSAKLSSNQQYEATANLKLIIPEIDKKKEQFKFTFQTLKQNYEISIGGLKLYDSNDLSRVKIEGQIQTADVVEIDEVQQMLIASQKGSTLEIDWQSEDDLNFFFTINEVRRAKEADLVKLTISGEPIGVDKNAEMDVEVPSIEDYKVVSSQITRGNDSYISVLFSDPLDARQNLNGLVSLSNTRSKPRLVMSLNELKIYPTQEMQASATLTINKAIKNSAGFSLKDDYETTLQFSQIKPEVRLVDKQEKSILPNSSGLILPFEAAGLNAVDVTVVEIFEDNVQQYLQVNNLGGQSQLRRVGKPVVRKRVPLNTSGVTNLNSWNRFTLNLEDILKAKQGSVYQINIGFRKQYSLFFCPGNDQIESLGDDWDWSDAAEEDSYWDSYDYYYNPNYNWQERDNPCSDSYYGTRRNVSKILFASDLGIIAKRRDDGKLSVFVTNLISAQPLSGVSMEVFDYQQQLIGKASSNSEGKATIELDQEPYLVVAKVDDQLGYLKINDGNALSLSNFDVTGTQVQKGLKGFIYGERGVWRPGDEVHLGFIMQDIEESLPEGHPVIMELYNPQRQLSQRKISSEGVGNMFRFDFETDSDAPTGNWLARAKVGGAVFEKTVKIETIKPNRLKINLDLDKEVFTVDDRSVSGDLSVRWLTGATASNLKAEYEVLFKPATTTFKNYPNFSFDDASKEFNSSRELIYQGRVDAEGNARIYLDLETSNAPGALNAMLFGKVYEEGGDFSINNTTVPFYPYSSFVGLKTPEGDKRGILLTDKDHSVRIATVDATGAPISRRGLQVKLFKLNWKWWWDSSYEYLSNYVGRSYRSAIQSETVNSTNGEGTFDLRINYPDWGRYYLQVKDPVSGHSAGQIVYLDWPGWAGKGKRGELGGASMLDFGVEKEEYQVGESIKLSIPSTEGNRILVSLETGSEVLQTFWVDSEQETTTVAFDATADMAPNIYIHLTMIQPHGQTSTDLPIRLYGIQSVKVVDPATTLKPTIELPNELRPGQKYEVRVAEENKKAMSYTVAVVDEGLLDITNFKTPDPWNSFYKREALGIKTWDVYDDVIGAFSGQMDRLLAIGGDEELNPKEQTETNRFKPVVKFLGPFSLKKGESNTHEIEMPQYIGSVKTMVVASSNNSFGNADATTPVKQPLMVLATLPRVAGPGETIRLPVNTFVLDDNLKNVQLNVEASGNLTINGKSKANLNFSGPGDEVTFFELKAKEVLGEGKVKVTATAGSVTATYDVSLAIIPRNPTITTVKDAVIDPGGAANWEYSPIGILGENSGAVEVSTLPPLNIESRLAYLIKYPHGCIEQTTSSVFAQLYLSGLISLSEEKQNKIQQNIDAAIQRLKSFQLPNGGFAYWQGNGYANLWGSNYAGHFLVEAQKAGYAVPESMLSNWIGFQTDQAESWRKANSDRNTELTQAYRLYTLALIDSESMGSMNRFKEEENLSSQAKWRLALAYLEAGYEKQAKKIIEGLSSEVSSDTNYAYTFGSSIRDQAMILEALLSLGEQSAAFELLMEIAEKMGDNDQWMSTQTTAYCFIAISKYAQNFDLDKETRVDVTINNSSTNIESTDFSNQITINDPDQASSIMINNAGATPVFARLISTGIPVEGEEEAVSRNLNFSVRYVDADGDFLRASDIKQGTNFFAEVEVTNPGLKGDYTELTLTQIFPSGWEIINTRLDGSDDGNSKAEYIDIRDDRVMHYFDLKPNEKATFKVMLNASYQGYYYLPGVKVEAMYDNSIFASKSGQWITISATK